MRFFREENKATICVTPSVVAVCARLASSRSGAPRVSSTWCAPTGAGSSVEEAAIQRVREGIEWLCTQSAGKYVDISLFLSDFWLHHRRLDFSALPSRASARNALIQWRMAQELDLPAEALSTAWQTAGADSLAVYAVGVDREFSTRLTEVVNTANFGCSHLGSLSHGVMNAAPSVSDGLVGWLADDHWLAIRIRGDQLIGVRAQRGEGAEGLAAFERDIARAITEHGFGGITLTAFGARASALPEVEEALRATAPGLDIRCDVACDRDREQGEDDELLFVARRLAEAA